MENKVIKDSRYAYAADIRSIVEDYTHLEEKYDTRWYRGKETVMSENPYSNWLTKKNWPLNEELNLHMLLFQQVKVLAKTKGGCRIIKRKNNYGISIVEVLTPIFSFRKVRKMTFS